MGEETPFKPSRRNFLAAAATVATTLNGSDSVAERNDPFAQLPLLPKDEEGPVFAEPWQAHAFALAVELSARGHFTWAEWAAALTKEIQAASHGSEPDDGSNYYSYWLAALERLVTTKGLSDPTELHIRKEAWADAYRHTPHGKPIELSTNRDSSEHS
jgi:nitrile hydratase accessory protein